MATLPQKQKDDIASTISKLVIDASAKKTASAKSKSKKAKEPVAESWEDEDVSSSSSSEDEDGEEAESDEAQDRDSPEGGYEVGTSTPSSLATPAVPPPTPASPLAYDSPGEWAARSPMDTGSGSGSGSGSGNGNGTPPARRPEKTDAVARRMIAAGLGLKAPRQTDEQRAYQRSVREQEKKRREAERAEEQRRREMADRAKAAVWED